MTLSVYITKVGEATSLDLDQYQDQLPRFLEASGKRWAVYVRREARQVGRIAEK